MIIIIPQRVAREDIIPYCNTYFPVLPKYSLLCFEFPEHSVSLSLVHGATVLRNWCSCSVLHPQPCLSFPLSASRMLYLPFPSFLLTFLCFEVFLLWLVFIELCLVRLNSNFQSYCPRHSDNRTVCVVSYIWPHWLLIKMRLHGFNLSGVS